MTVRSGNDVFNGIRLFMCTTSVAFLHWQRVDSDVVVSVEQPDASLASSHARPPPWYVLCMIMALTWSQVAIAVAVGSSCMSIIADSKTIADIILNFLALIFITQLSTEIMTARIINREGAMGGMLVPVLRLDWTQLEHPNRPGIRTAQKLLILFVVPVWHWLLIAIVDVTTFVKNTRYAGGNLVAFTVGWALMTGVVLILDAALPWLLHKLQTVRRLLLALLLFEVIGLLMQSKTSSALTSGNLKTDSTIMYWGLRGSQFTYFLFAAMGLAESGGGNEMGMPATLALCFISTHLGRMSSAKDRTEGLAPSSRPPLL